MVQMTISPFVNVINKEVAAEFDLVVDKIDYPVFGIDVVDGEDGNSDTLFLIANQKGEFIWISTNDVRRAKKNNQKYKPNI